MIAFDHVGGRRLHGRRGLKSPRIALIGQLFMSPPSRAAWIEMDYDGSGTNIYSVAAFTGGVD